MKMKNKKLVALVVCVIALSVIVIAAGDALLSPALVLIEKQLAMKKCSVNGENVRFTAEDFDKVLCCDVEFIKLEELPDSTQGTLNMGSLKLAENQILGRADLNKLVFCPKDGVTEDASFVFSNATAGQSEICVECVIHIFLIKKMSNPLPRI